MVRIIPVEYPSFDEPAIAFESSTVADIPQFRATAFSRQYMYTTERADANIILSTLASLNLVPAAIRHSKGLDYIVTLSNRNTVALELKTIITPEEAMTQQIQDLSAGLMEWYYGDPAHKVDPTLQATFVIPSLRNLDAADVFDELKQYVISRLPSAQESNELVSISADFPTLAKLDTQVLVRRGKIPFVQVSRGAMSVSGPEAGIQRVLATIANAKRAEHSASPQSMERWLVIWFQTLYSAFSVDSVKRYLEDVQARPFSRILISDGRKLAVLSEAD